ncbi:hypothetical protein MM326_15010 [Alkalihalobacillus sp. LMS6]|uniref:hypothetical protein n=1 Tax=Alkalihalobacillus sp. LMS6 TaxID=2924034 RepID=UPI0020D0318A|nr:hypothetical protein [Alkalihalobacillus sp. LMS6]UTR05406.1 hypothetical protein MM326_15010 [Alkalihalobacillus sp. LMS6]
MIYIIVYLIVGMIIAGLLFGKSFDWIMKNIFSDEEIKLIITDNETDEMKDKIMGAMGINLILSILMVFFYPFMTILYLGYWLSKRKVKGEKA